MKKTFTRITVNLHKCNNLHEANERVGSKINYEKHQLHRSPI